MVARVTIIELLAALTEVEHEELDRFFSKNLA